MNAIINISVNVIINNIISIRVNVTATIIIKINNVVESGDEEKSGPSGPVDLPAAQQLVGAAA